jgi:DNA-binding PadR family transcriptional regulator
VVNGRARRFYALTDAGDAALRDEAARMAEAVKAVTGRRHRRPIAATVTP